MSFCTRPMVAAKIAVSAPTIATVFMACGASTNSAFERATMYTPAVTMVAAWIRADTGVGPSIASGNQTYNGNCADLPQAPTNSSRHAPVITGSPIENCPLRASAFTEVYCSEPKYHAIDDERFVGRRGGRMAQEIEADQQVGAQAHAFPSHEHQGVVVGQNQRQHREHEQVHVPEEAVIPALVSHVADRVDVDQHAHTGHEQQPYARQRIEQDSSIGLELRRMSTVGDVAERTVAGAQPGEHHFLEGLAGIGGRVTGVLPNRRTRAQERQRDQADANAADRRLRQLASKKEHASRTNGGKQRNQPDVV